MMVTWILVLVVIVLIAAGVAGILWKLLQEKTKEKAYESSSNRNG